MADQNTPENQPPADVNNQTPTPPPQQPIGQQHGDPQPGYVDPNQAQAGYAQPGCVDPSAQPQAGYQQPGYVDPNQAQPGYTQPGYVDPNAQPQAGYTQPGYVDPNQAQAGYTQPGYVDPNAQPQAGYTQPGYAGPSQTQVGYTQPGYAGPSQTQVGYTQPGYVDPNAQPQAGYQQPGYVDPNTQHQGYQQPGYVDPNQAQAGYTQPEYVDPNTQYQGYQQPGYPPGGTIVPDAGEAHVFDDDDEWQRPSWRQLLISLPSLLTVVLITIIAKSTFDSLMPVLIAFFAFGIGAIGDVVRVLTSRYRLTDTLIEEKSQFITTSHASTLVSRIRTVSIDQKWIQRILSIADVKVTSGSDTDNVTIKGITLAQANELKHTLDTHPARAEKSGATPQTHGSTQPTPTATGHPGPAASGLGTTTAHTTPMVPFQPQILTQLKPQWTWRSAITGPGIFPLLAIFGLLQFVPGLSIESIVTTVTEFVADNEAAWRDDAESWSIFGLGTLASWIVSGIIAALAFAAVTYLANAIAYIVRHYGYKLTRLNPTTLEMVQGLFTRKTTSIDLERMRGLNLTSGPVERLAKTARLEAILTEGSMERLTADNNITPRIPRDEAIHVANELSDPPGLLDLELTPHGPRAARRLFIGAARETLIWAALIWAVTTYTPLGNALWWLLLPLGIWSFISAWLHYRALGYALPEGYVALRSGFWNQEHKAVQRRVALGIQISQSLWQRPAGVTTLTLMDTADGHHLPDLTPEASHKIAYTVHPDLLNEFLAQPATPAAAATTPAAATTAEPAPTVPTTTGSATTGVAPSGQAWHSGSTGHSGATGPTVQGGSAGLEAYGTTQPGSAMPPADTAMPPGPELPPGHAVPPAQPPGPTTPPPQPPTTH